MDYSYISCAMDLNVLDLEAILILLMSMGMPNLGRENSFLNFVDGYYSWISCSGTFMGTSMHPPLSKFIMYSSHHFSLLTSHIRGHLL
jgi:hypothetical protein